MLLLQALQARLMNADELSALVGSVYEAALSPQGWREALSAIVDATRSRSGVIVSQNPHDLSILSTINVGFDPAMRELYNQAYWEKDVWTLSLSQLPKGKMYPSAAGVRQRDFRKSTIYNEFCRRQDVEFGAGAFYPFGDELLRLAFQRTRAQGEFSARDIQALELIAPHIVRALRTARIIAEKEETITALMQATPWICIMIDTSCRIVALSRAAKAFLDRESRLFRLRDGYLYARDRRLRSALSENCEARVVRIHLDNEGPLTVARIPMRMCEAVVASRRLVCIIISQWGRDAPSISKSALKSAFGLTASESKIAVALARGQTVPAIQVSLGVTRNTMKSHLRSIYSKTSCCSQAQVVAKLLGQAALWNSPVKVG